MLQLSLSIKQFFFILSKITSIYRHSLLKTAAAISLSLLPAIPVSATQQTSTQSTIFNAEILNRIQRLSSVEIAPDNHSVVYLVRSTDLQADRGQSHLWIANIQSGRTTQLTKHTASDSSPHWSSDSRSVFFLSARTGSTQIWKIQIDSHRLTQVTDFELAVTSYKLSHKQDKIIFSAAVFPACSGSHESFFKCTHKYKKQLEKKPANGTMYRQIFVRHWDQWLDKLQSQLFVVGLDEQGKAQQNVVAVSHNINASVPSSPFGGDEEYTLSQDGRYVYFSARIQDAKEPVSTNFDIYRADLKNDAKLSNITADNKAWDTQPTISPDGKFLAYLAMKRPGYESDKLDLIMVELATGIKKNITDKWDRSFSDPKFSLDGKFIYLRGNNIGTKALWRLNLSDLSHQLINSFGYVSSFSIAHNKMVYLQDDLKHPSRLFASQLDGSNKKLLLTHNKKLLAKIKFGEYEQFNFLGWNDEKVHGYLIKPSDFDANKKYPLVFIIHGGPQGSANDHFHYRWNPQTYSSEGFVVVMIDFHGSTGYGQKFTDSISQHWGSRPLEDLKKGLAFAENKYPFIDGEKACALGASYGGYMINWIESHWPNKFKCLVNHDGVFDNRMMYYSTEELWFVEWENGGSYYENSKQHEKFNPVNYVEQWKTPMLLIHGGHDFRIPETQSLGAFTALQKRGIESQLLYFPNENHWVLSPNNSIQWHQEVNRWLHRFLD